MRLVRSALLFSNAWDITVSYSNCTDSCVRWSSTDYSNKTSPFGNSLFQLLVLMLGTLMPWNWIYCITLSWTVWIFEINFWWSSFHFDKCSISWSLIFRWDHCYACIFFLICDCMTEVSRGDVVLLDSIMWSVCWKATVCLFKHVETLTKKMWTRVWSVVLLIVDFYTTYNQSKYCINLFFFYCKVVFFFPAIHHPEQQMVLLHSLIPTINRMHHSYSMLTPNILHWGRLILSFD